MNAPERSARKVVGDDLRRPKGNVTGVAIKYEEWSAKRLELVRDLLPKARRVAVVTDAVDWGYGLDPLKAAGRGLGLEVVVCDVARHGAREGSVEVGNRALAITLQEMLRIRPDAFMAFGAFNATNRFKMFVDFERKHRLPYIGDGSGDGVAGYGMDYADHERRLLEIIVQILRGKKPADIPVDFTSRFLLTVDLKRAKEIGVEIPASILVRADQLSQ